MENQNIVRRGTKRRRASSSSTVQNQASKRKMVIILDDTWLEALKHLTCLQWSKMSLVCRLVNGIVQRNISRLPRQVIESITLNSKYLSFHPRFSSVASSLQKLFHPASYIKNVTMHAVNQKLIDAHFNGEERYIRCQNFVLLPYFDKSRTRQKIAQSLEWLKRNVRTDSLSFPKWMFDRIQKTVKIRAMLINIVFDASLMCNAEKLVFSFHEYSYHSAEFLALPVIQSTIPTVVIDDYPDQGQYRTQFGENLIDREVDSQGAKALYVIESGQKRIRISFCRRDQHIYGPYKAYLKFYTS
ncbi:hypothetical protein DdX_20406 [Ditylenchus destructor]|uniref:Uncharacterized protein n=1 Tax=Ditylenchus destructor TaxID=166010 RepID=A0AAD4MGE3_9BILA|nr:hypothetical protein DdX_20406 [Ditylenchus destructor]